MKINDVYAYSVDSATLTKQIFAGELEIDSYDVLIRFITSSELHVDNSVQNFRIIMFDRMKDIYDLFNMDMPSQVLKYRNRTKHPSYRRSDSVYRKIRITPEVLWQLYMGDEPMPRLENMRYI